MTNGELFQALYPNIVVKENGTCMWLFFDKDEYTHYTTPTSWWNEEIPSLPQTDVNSIIAEQALKAGSNWTECHAPQDDCDTECIYCKHCFEGSEFENATPQRPTGHWIDDNANEIDAKYGRHLYKCSECNRYAEDFVGGHEDWWDVDMPNYCPYCGSYNGGDNNG